MSLLRPVAPPPRLLPGFAAVLTVFVLTACATNGVSVRRLPPETPAADNAAAIKNAQAVVESAKPPQPPWKPSAPPRATATQTSSRR